MVAGSAPSAPAADSGCKLSQEGRAPSARRLWMSPARPSDRDASRIGSLSLSLRHGRMDASRRMIGTTRADVVERVASPRPAGETGKVLVLAGDDSRETSAHCRVLIDALQGIARELVVVGRYARGEETDARSIGRIDLDCGGDWHGPLAKAGDAWKLARIVEAERPGVVHAIGLRPAALAGLALRLARAER